MLRTYLAALTKGEKRLRLLWLIGSGFAVLVTAVLLIVQREYLHLRMCVATLVLPFAPAAVEMIGRFRFHPVFYSVCAFYTLTPMLGECYKLYYVTPWWDKGMHALAGVVVALLGFPVFRALAGAAADKKKRIAAALFAFLLSVTVSVMWEFVEYTADALFDMDSQHDVVVTEIHSYQLGEKPGEVGHLTGVSETTVDGATLPVDGYLDIGLHDTMGDMLAETFGALIATLAYTAFCRRRSLFEPFSADPQKMLDRADGE